jgi:hypothetical protein
MPILDYWNETTPDQAFICELTISYFFIDQIFDFINDPSIVYVVHHWSVCCCVQTKDLMGVGAAAQLCS